ncbi:MAG: DUF488 family protein [Terriglobales bacterium]
MAATIYTIGHSNRDVQDFLALLLEHGLTAIADVRSQPYSHVNPQFNRESLAEFLGKHGIAYVFLGEELGARPRDTSCYIDGKVQYDRLARTKLFEQGLNRIERGAMRYQLALMCAEKEPLACHRSILVSRHLVRRGFQVSHIIDSRMAEDHAASLARLLESLGIDGVDMFNTRDELVELAYEKQAAKIAFSREYPDGTRRRESA